MFCVNCGKQIPDTVKFCTFCGTKVEPQETEPIYNAPVQPEAVAEAVPVSPVTYAAPQKSSKLPVIIAIILTVILLGVGIFAISKLMDSLSFSSPESAVEKVDDEREQEKEELEEEQTVPAVVEMPEEIVVADDAVVEEVLANAAMLADSGDFSTAIDMIRKAQETYGDDPAYQEVLALYEAYLQTEPPVLTTADMISHESIAPLMEQALAMRAEADAKWDHKEEIPGNCEYKGYIYQENPENLDDNRLYLVFMMNATIKDVPIQFIYWVFYNDIAFDDAGTISYRSMGTSRDDGYTVKTAFGSYYSYYGLDNYDLFFEKIILTNGYELVAEKIHNVAIEHPVSDTFN